VCIGEGSVIGAGAAVTQDIPDGVVAVGVPARVIKKIDDNFDRYGRVLAGIERR
jgi:maltose O-acetyltransferase